MIWRARFLIALTFLQCSLALPHDESAAQTVLQPLASALSGADGRDGIEVYTYERDGVQCTTFPLLPDDVLMNGL